MTEQDLRELSDNEVVQFIRWTNPTHQNVTWRFEPGTLGPCLVLQVWASQKDGYGAYRPDKTIGMYLVADVRQTLASPEVQAHT